MNHEKLNTQPELSAIELECFYQWSYIRYSEYKARLAMEDIDPEELAIMDSVELELQKHPEDAVHLLENDDIAVDNEQSSGPSN